MRALGDEDDLAVLAARFQRCLDRQHPAQLAVRPCLGGHGDGLHACQRDQPVRQLVDHAQRALHGFLRLQRVDIGKAGHPRDFLVQSGIVLHRAGAERERTEIDGVILPREAGVVPHGLGLGQAGQRRGGLAQEAR